MLSGSPPCSPQTPSPTSPTASRARATAIRISSADALDVQGLERAAIDEAALQVLGHEPALHVIAGEAGGGLREVVGPEAEEVGVSGEPAGGEAGPRQLDHRPHPISSGRSRFAAPTRPPLRLSTQGGKLALVCDQRQHHLDLRRLSRLATASPASMIAPTCIS